jgi:hypothetical protein
VAQVVKHQYNQKSEEEKEKEKKKKKKLKKEKERRCCTFYMFWTMVFLSSSPE